MARTGVHVALTEAIVERARALESRGLGGFDALQLASAIVGKTDHLLTTDDRFIATIRRLRGDVGVSVRNPVELVMKETR